MKKNLLTLSLVVLLIIFGYLLEVNRTKLFGSYSVSNKENNKGSEFSLPVSATSKNVNGVSVHYFFTGKLKELKETTNGIQIIYENPDPDMPELFVTDTTRVSKITPPYDLNHVIIKTNELKSGQTVVISAEYNLLNSSWKLLDVYLATDRN